jgi:hypothetical protein
MYWSTNYNLRLVLIFTGILLILCSISHLDGIILRLLIILFSIYIIFIGIFHKKALKDYIEKYIEK